MKKNRIQAPGYKQEQGKVRLNFFFHVNDGESGFNSLLNKVDLYLVVSLLRKLDENSQHTADERISGLIKCLIKFLIA